MASSEDIYAFGSLVAGLIGLAATTAILVHGRKQPDVYLPDLTRKTVIQGQQVVLELPKGEYVVTGGVYLDEAGIGGTTLPIGGETAEQFVSFVSEVSDATKTKVALQIGSWPEGTFDIDIVFTNEDDADESFEFEFSAVQP